MSTIFATGCKWNCSLCKWLGIARWLSEWCEFLAVKSVLLASGMVLNSSGFSVLLLLDTEMVTSFKNNVKALKQCSFTMFSSLRILFPG